MRSSGFSKTDTSSADAGRHVANQRFVLVGALAVLVVLVIACAAVAGLAWHESQLAAYQQAGGSEYDQQDEGDAEPDKTERMKPYWEAPRIVSLRGLSQEQAIAAIGHGAAVKSEEAYGALGDRKHLTIALAAERSKDQAGAPTVQLWIDEDGKVERAVYSASVRGFGFSNKLTFRQAVAEAHAVELALADIGVDVPVGTVRLPEDPREYSTYRDDGATLEREHVEFKGAGKSGGKEVLWTASLDYDYAEAIQTGDLVYTHRVLAVGVVL